MTASLLAGLLSGMLAGCVPPQTAPAIAPSGGLRAVDFGALPGWDQDDLAQSLPGLIAECRRMALLPADTALGGTGLAALRAGRAGQWQAACQAALALPPGDEAATRAFYESWFQPYRVDAPGLFTGYYEPVVRGALARFGAYQTALLGRPTDLVQMPAPDGDGGSSGVAPPLVGRLQDGKLVPYWTRAEIEDGHARTARPLLWLADPIDLFFLQVQGSGRVRLPDGTIVRVGYDGKNGRAYTPIGRVLVRQGALGADDVTMQSIRAWLEAHPAQARAVMDRNEDYVFFRILSPADGDEGPPGALGVDLRAGRAAAVDRHAIALGTPVFVATTDPVSGGPWRHLVLAQDLGTDIRGAARVDIFMGAGVAAEQKAGAMRQGGVVYVLLLRRGGRK